MWGLEDVATVIQAAAVETGIKRLRVLCPVLSCPGHPRQAEVDGRGGLWGTGVSAGTKRPLGGRTEAGSQARARWGSGAGHLLVGENPSDAAVSGSKHSQEAIPEGSGEMRSQACFRQDQGPAATPASCPPPRLGGAYVLRSWSRHTRSTSCCVMPVSKIRLCRRKLLPGTGE